ncbi:MAG: hypothetical protein E6417_19605, partial [Bradyrhizobium sp.]|nr:hypothetical protein [Bradyrhizobium sp.]
AGGDYHHDCSVIGGCSRIVPVDSYVLGVHRLHLGSLACDCNSRSCAPAPSRREQADSHDHTM